MWVLRGEADEPSTDTEARARACRGTNRGSIDIKNRERGKGDECDHADFGHTQGLAREHVRCNSNSKTFQCILHNATNEVAHINSGCGGFRFRHFISSQREIIGRNT
jgi:hypothetical protein